MKKFRCCSFDVHDQELIEGAYITGQPEHVAQAVKIAVAGFQQRLGNLPNGLPIIDGRPHLLVSSLAAGNFFDQYVLRLTLQEIADHTGKIVTVIYSGEKQRTNKPSSPDIEFTK